MPNSRKENRKSFCMPKAQVGLFIFIIIFLRWEVFGCVEIEFLWEPVGKQDEPFRLALIIALLFQLPSIIQQTTLKPSELKQQSFTLLLNLCFG